MDRGQVDNPSKLIISLAATEQADSLDPDILRKKLIDLLGSRSQSSDGIMVDGFLRDLIERLGLMSLLESDDKKINELIRDSLRLPAYKRVDKRALVIDVEYEDTHKRPRIGPKTRTMTSDQHRA